MSKLQKILLPVVVLILVVLIIVTWGSIASVIFASTLIGAIPVYLFNRFINSDSGSDFTGDQNG